jgi:hypothetical protein
LKNSNDDPHSYEMPLSRACVSGYELLTVEKQKMLSTVLTEIVKSLLSVKISETNNEKNVCFILYLWLK